MQMYIKFVIFAITANMKGMFDKEVYIRRRQVLKEKMTAAAQDGIVIFIGNVDAPAQYKDNGYKFRQDSCWLYYFGIDEPRYAAIIDLDSGDESIWADDVDIDDIIWTGRAALVIPAYLYFPTT